MYGRVELMHALAVACSLSRRLARATKDAIVRAKLPEESRGTGLQKVISQEVVQQAKARKPGPACAQVTELVKQAQYSRWTSMCPAISSVDSHAY